MTRVELEKLGELTGSWYNAFRDQKVRERDLFGALGDQTAPVASYDSALSGNRGIG